MRSAYFTEASEGDVGLVLGVHLAGRSMSPGQPGGLCSDSGTDAWS